MALETKTFFDIAQKNDLISESKLEKLRTGIKKETLSDVDFDALVSKKVLTPWQAKRFLSGKENFKVGRYRLLDFIGKDEFGEVYLVKGDSKSYLRLVAKELCADPKRREHYLARVNAFKKLDLSRFPKITDVSKIGERLIVVSDVVNGLSVAKRCNGKSQSEKLVKQVTAKIAQAVVAMESAKLKHGSINEHSVLINGAQKVVIHLPRDLSFDFRNKQNVSGDEISDVRSLTNLACGMLAGDFEKPKADTELFKQLDVVAAESDSKTSLKKLQAIVGAKAVPSPKNEEDDSVLDSVPPIPNLDNVSVNSELPSVNADGLENITTPKEDMFGDLDDMSIESAIQAQPQKIIPAIVESDSSSTKVTAKKKKPKESTASDDNEPQPNTQKTIILAALGGAVAALSIGLVVYFVFFNGATDDGNSGSKVAKVKATSASDKSKSQREEQTPNDSKDTKTPDREKKKLETTSSGIFSKVGAINEDAKTETSNLETSDSDPEKLTPKTSDDKAGTGAEGDAMIGTQPAAGKDVAKKETDPTKPPTTDPISTDPNSTGANDIAKNDPAKKVDEESKMENGEESAIVLVGKSPSKDKDDGKTKNDFDLNAIFAKAPRAVALPESESTRPKKLFDIAIPPSLPMTLTLQGGDKATRGKFEFLMRSSTSENATWLVSMKTNSSVTDPIAKFVLEGQSLGFQWTNEAAKQSNAKFLMNCGVKISARGVDHKLSLREPVVASMLTFERSFSPTAEAKLSDLPQAENIKIQLVHFSDNFPSHIFVGKKNEIAGRNGAITILCKPENIDALKVKFTSRTRGSKMFVNGESHFITPDKREIKLSSISKFELEANREIARITQLQINFAELMNQYNKLDDPNAKREFTIKTKRADIEKRVQVDKPIKAHLERSIALLKKVNEAKIGIRIFYQAGEIEVDLATPDGKPYTPPKPVEAEKKK